MTGVFPIRYGREEQESRSASLLTPGHQPLACKITSAVSFSGAGFVRNSHLATR
jgi:hypothetical protein